ncbi:hypothetical protein AHAS_Ahas11G0239700 [Arachis hypogaea]
MTKSLKYLLSSMDPMNLYSKSDLLILVIVVTISLLLYLIISIATLSTTPIASFNFFSEPMFNNHFSFHMSGDDDIARYTDSLDTRSKLSVSLDFGRKGMKYSGVVVELDLEDVVDVVRVEGDAVIEDMEVCAIRMTVTPWLDLGVEEEKGKDGEEDYEDEERKYEC